MESKIKYVEMHETTGARIWYVKYWSGRERWYVGDMIPGTVALFVASAPVADDIAAAAVTGTRERRTRYGSRRFAWYE